jgi:TetR/AcrR family transcriptional regulator, cholesterol catabolism regulator
VCYDEGVDGYQKRKQRSREAILRSALELFAGKGIRGVSVAQVARRAGVDPVTVYNHFQDRDGLVRAVVQGLMADHWARVRGILEADEPFLSRLERVISVKNEMADLYDSELVRSALSTDPVLSGMAASLFEKEVNPLLVRFLKGGQREGAVRSDLSVETLRIYIDMFIDLGRTHPQLFADQGRLSKATREIWALFLHGISGAGGEKRRTVTRAG